MWELYKALNTQFVYDFRVSELVFEIYDLDMTRREAYYLLADLIMIHQLFSDDKKKKQERETKNKQKPGRNVIHGTHPRYRRR